jgi:hypothetical protein
MYLQASKRWIKSGIQSMRKLNCAVASVLPVTLAMGLLLCGDAHNRTMGNQAEAEAKKVDDWQAVQLDKNDPAYKSIKDREPLAQPLENPDEFLAFVSIMLKARKTPDELLARHSQPNVAYEDLVGDAKRPLFLRSLLKIKGKLVRVAEAELPTPLKPAGATHLYKASIATDGDPERPAFVFFTDLPPELAALDRGNMTVECDGYYFKLTGYRDKQGGFEDAFVDKYAPLLLAKTIKVVKVEAPVRTELSEEQRVQLDKKDESWDSVFDERPLGSLQENPVEYRQYNLVFKQANEFSPEVLRKYARRDVVFADMIGRGRDEYLRELLHIEGTLVRLRKRNATGRLQETSPIKEVYEGWIRLDSNSKEKEDDRLINIVFCDLPEGLKPGEGNNYKHRVAFDGYYFKLLGYESPETDKQSKKKIWRMAPMMIGRTIEPLDVVEPTNPIIPAVLVVLGIAGAAMVGLIFWFRRGDRKVHKRAHEALTKANPFEQAGTQAVEPGDGWNGSTNPSQP